MNKWLHHHGFSYKKPKGVPHKLKPEEQQAFIEYYNEVLKSNDAPVLFMDAVHPTQSTKLSYGWIRKGQDKLIETTGSRTRVNLIGALPLKEISDTCSGQLKLATVLEFSQYNRSDSLGVKPPLY